MSQLELVSSSTLYLGSQLESNSSSTQDLWSKLESNSSSTLYIWSQFEPLMLAAMLPVSMELPNNPQAPSTWPEYRVV